MLNFGQLFGSNFWSSFKSQPSESIEKLLKKENCHIEELLDDSDLLQECKNSNKNLISYLNREKIKQLIDFITVMPEEDEHNRGHKYPFYASEVFSCDMTEVIDKFFTPPCEDVRPDESDNHEEDDSAKIESGFEKEDNEDSNSDSEEEGADNEQHKDDEKAPESTEKPNDTGDDILNFEDIEKDQDDNKDAKEAPETSEAQHAEEKKEEQEILDVEDKTQEKSLDTADTSASTSSQDNSNEKLDHSDEKLTEATSTPSEEKVSEATSEEKKEEAPAAEAPKQTDSVEETPQEKTETTQEIKQEEKQEQEAAPTEKKDVEENIDTGAHTSNPFEDDDTVVSEATTEVSAKSKPKLSSNKYDLLDYLTRFLNTDEEINDVLAGYFGRLCNLLIQKKNEEMGRYFYTHEEVFYRFAYHCYSKSISDTAIKILDINVDKLEINESEIKRIRAEFIKRLLERLADDKSEVSYEYSLNIFQIFNELTFKKAYYGMLIEDQVLNTLGDILEKESPECSSNAAIRIINVLISHLRDHLSNANQPPAKTFISSGFDESDEDNVVLFKDNTENDSQNKVNETISNSPLVTFFKTRVIDFITNGSQLKKAPAKNIIDFQYGNNQFVLGKKRLAYINLMESLVELEDAGIRDKILESDFYETLFDLFLEFRFNTFLQLHMDNIFHCILKDTSPSATIEKKVAFLQKLKIFKKLPAFWNDNQQFAFPSQREFRHGYLAFTTRMANTLRDLAKAHPEIAEMTSAEDWKNFQQNDVDVYNEKNSIVLASKDSKRKESSDLDNMDDEDQRFKDLDERDDLDDKDDDDEEDDYTASRNSMRETLQAYDPSKARDEHEQLFVGETVEKDEEEDNLFSGLNQRAEEDSDEDKPIGGPHDDQDEDTKGGDSENRDYYDNSYWQINQFSIDDLLSS